MDSALAPRLLPIRLLVLDVDGVLTDGGLYYSEAGLQFKRFNSKDGLGLKLIASGGITLALLSGDPSPITTARAKRLQIPSANVLLNVDDKLVALQSLAERLELTLAQCAYMGDDLNDVQCLAAVGLGAAPADAVPEARAAAHYVCTLGGGAGCVREVCDLIRIAQAMPLPAHFIAGANSALPDWEFNAAP